MTYKGHVRNGVIVLDEPVALEEGAEVAVEVVKRAKPVEQDHTELEGRDIAKERYELYRDLIGAIKDTPPDWSENHDKYISEE